MAYTGEEAAGHWWATLPDARVVRLDGTSTELVALSLDPLPESAPAVVFYRPSAAVSLTAQVNRFLDELDRTSIRLFPRWLPGASNIHGPQGAATPAVRALAFDVAAASEHFGPFLADLAVRSLGARSDSGGFAAEVRAAGLARVIAAAYDRRRVALLIEIPDGLDAQEERVLVSSIEWIAHHGGCSVWITGAQFHDVDRIESAAIRLPAHLETLAAEERPGLVQPAMVYPAPTGAPHPGSAAELALEAALALNPWAAGRTWNQTYRSHVLGDTFRLDLLWSDERIVVEVDGPDHHGAAKYAADRRRDVQLILDGYTVIRFTNAHIRDDVGTVVSQIAVLVRSRRLGSLENHRHG